MAESKITNMGNTIRAKDLRCQRWILFKFFFFWVSNEKVEDDDQEGLDKGEKFYKEATWGRCKK